MAKVSKFSDYVPLAHDEPNLMTRKRDVKRLMSGKYVYESLSNTQTMDNREESVVKILTIGKNSSSDIARLN
jgi:hypothetical protein